MHFCYSDNGSSLSFRYASCVMDLIMIGVLNWGCCRKTMLIASLIVTLLQYMMIQTNFEASVSSHLSRPRSATLFTDKQPVTSTTISAQKNKQHPLDSCTILFRPSNESMCLLRHIAFIDIKHSIYMYESSYCVHKAVIS